MKKFIKILVGSIITIGIVVNYIFPTTITFNDYGTYIEFFDGSGYLIENNKKLDK